MSAEALGKKELELGFRSNLSQLRADLAGMKKDLQSLGSAASTNLKGNALDALGLQAKAGLVPLADFKKAIQDLITEAQKANKVSPEFINDKALADAQGKIRQLQRDMDKLRASSSGSVKSSTADLVQAMELQVKAGLKPLTELRTAYQKFAIESRQTLRVNPNDAAAQKSFAQAVLRLRELRKEIDGVEPKVESLRDKLGKIGGALQAVSLPIAGLSAALGLLLAKASGDFAKFEKTLNTIEAVSSATSAEIAAIKQESFELGQQTVFSNQQVVDSFEELAKAGFTARESLAAMPKLLELAAAAGGDLEVASSIVGSNLKAFGLQVEETGRLVDVIAQAANRSAASIEDMGFAFKQVAPLAAQTGQSVEDVSALLSVLANNAVKGADAGSDLRNIMTRLLNPTKEVAAAMGKLGISLKNQNGTVKPLVQLFQELNTKFAALSPASRAQAASILAGAENLKSFLILAGTAPAEIDKMVFAMNHSTGAAELMANTMQKGLSNAIEQFQGSVETLSTQLGESLAPAFELVLKAATKLTGVLIENRSMTTFAAGAGIATAGLLGLTTAAAGAVAIFGPFKVALAGLGIGLAELLPVLSIATGVILGAGGLAVSLEETARRAELAKRSILTLNAELNNSVSSIVAAKSDTSKLGKEYDDLSRKVKKSTEEETRRKEIIDILALKMPDQISKVVELTNKYGSMAKAIREVNIESAALENAKGLQKQLDDVNKAISSITRNKVSASNPLGSTVFSEGELDQLSSFQKQQESIIAKQKNNRADIIKAFQTADKEAQKATQSFGKSIDLSNTAKKTNDQIRSAQEQFKKLQEKLEVELTGFTEGEYAKRRAAADKNYQDEIRQIDNLGKKGKLLVGEMTDAKAKALEVFQQTLNKINKDETVFLENRARSIRDIGLQIQTLRAQISATNPFDDIQASLESNIETINNQYTDALQKLKEQFNFKDTDPAFKNAVRGLQIVRNLQLQNAKQVAKDTTTDALLKQQALNNQILSLEAKLSGSRVRIAQTTNQAIIDDLVIRRNAALAKYGESAKETTALSLELDAAIQQANKETAEKQIADQEDVIAAVNQEISVQGEKTTLLTEHKKALEVLVDLLERELQLTGLTAEERQAILDKLNQSRAALAQDNSKLSAFGAAMRGLENINLPSSQWTSFFKSTAKGLDELAGKFSTFKTQTGKGLFDFLKDNQGARSQLFSIGSQLTSTIGQSLQSNKNGFASSLTSVLSDAFSGAQTGGPIGAAVNIAVGSAGRALAAKGNFAQKYLRFIDPLGFRKLFGIDSQKAIEKAQKQLEKTQTFMTNVLNSADSNDLNSLTAALNRINKFKSGGGEAFGVKSQASQQIQDAIKARSKVIADTNEQLKLQNQQLSNTLSILDADAQPLDVLTVDRKNQLLELEAQTKKALDQFKDSAETMALIQQNTELQRQQIIQDSAEAILDAVVEEQTKIRTLRAQTAVIEAQNSGNQLQVIQAELTARLTALDADIQAFKGTEETKTAFLAQKTAERNAIIKSSQEDLDDLLQQGLDILNQGLVVGQTKADSQKQQLQKLFGTLNPQGLIQANGNLLNTQVTIGSGAFTFEINGVQDVNALLLQLSTNPVLQQRLRDIINGIFTRV